MVFKECCRGVLRSYNNASRNNQECFKEVSRKFQGRLNGCFKGISKSSNSFKWGFMEVSKVFQGCFKEVSRVLQESF